MGEFRVEISDEAKNDIAKPYKSGNKGDIKKLEIIINELSENPRLGVGQPRKIKIFYRRNLEQTN